MSKFYVEVWDKNNKLFSEDAELIFSQEYPVIPNIGDTISRKVVLTNGDGDHINTEVYYGLVWAREFTSAGGVKLYCEFH